MDHAEVRERLELAAAEPGGLERLMAGDTPESAAIAGHLAGCDDCADELRRLHGAAALIRDVVRSTPPADLRARTLAYVRALGRHRAPSTAPAPPVPATASAAPVTVPPVTVAPVDPDAPATGAARGQQRAAVPARWLAALAAALVVALAGTALVVGGQREAELARRAEAVRALERVAAAGVRVAAEPDAERVALRSTGGAATAGGEAAEGLLAFSPGTRELVVIARGLPRPAEGHEFRCWFETEGGRRPVGRMYFADEIAFWVGEVEAVADLESGSRFGVTLVDRDADTLDGDPALLGEL